MSETDASPGTTATDAETAARADAARRAALRSVLVIGGGVAALAVAAIATVLLVGSPGETTYSADSPEGAVQRYVQALEDGDSETAYGYFASEVQAEFSERDFEQGSTYYVTGIGFDASQSSRRIFLEQVDRENGEASVELRIEESFDSGPFGFPPYSYRTEIYLVLEDAKWKIADPLFGLEAAPPDFPFESFAP